MTEEKILVGTEEEIIDYCYEKSQSYRDKIPVVNKDSKSSLLITKEGFRQQMIDYNMNNAGPIKMGILFYLTRVKNEDVVALELKSVYFRISLPPSKEEIKTMSSELSEESQKEVSKIISVMKEEHNAQETEKK